MSSLSYHEQIDRKNILKLRHLIKDLPPFCGDLSRGVEPRTSSRTHITYTYGLYVFFDFLHKRSPVLAKKEIMDIIFRHLSQPSATDSEGHIEYPKYRFSEKNQEVMNKERGIIHRISSLRNLYNYCYRGERIKNNPIALVQFPKPHGEEVTRFDVGEVALLLDEVGRGAKLADKQKDYRLKTKVRDPVLPTLLLGTGTRVSECVGFNIPDIDFKNDGIRIYRKGGREVVIYSDIEMKSTLLDYLEGRDRITSEAGHEDTLFLSFQHKRMTARSAKNLVKRYTRTVSPLKLITPYKLRSTYGTNLYRETGDIHLTVGMLGHSDVNMIERHYATLKDERKRSTHSKARLREKQELS